MQSNSVCPELDDLSFVETVPEPATLANRGTRIDGIGGRDTENAIGLNTYTCIMHTEPVQTASIGVCAVMPDNVISNQVTTDAAVPASACRNVEKMPPAVIRDFDTESPFSHLLAQVRESTGWRFATATDKDMLELWLSQRSAFQAHAE